MNYNADTDSGNYAKILTDSYFNNYKSILQQELLISNGYNPQDIFKNKKKYIEEDIQSTQLIVIKKESFLQKIFNEIKRLFSKKT